MKHLKIGIPCLIVLLMLGRQASADFHLWAVNEVFSNADGTIQYVELFTTQPSEGNLAGHTLVTSAPGQANNVFTFNSGVSGSTANKTLLLATQRFANLTGLTPDFIIPAGFVRNEGTINFGEGADTLSYSKEQFPLNGSHSMNGAGQEQLATPKRFDGLSADIPGQAMPYAYFNENTLMMNVPVLHAPGIGIGNIDFAVDPLTLEFEFVGGYLYNPGLSPGDAPAFFDGTLYLPGLIAFDTIFEARMNIVRDVPLVFGVQDVYSVTPVPPDPEPQPDPGNELQASIARGQSQFQALCVTCHGVDGTGGGIYPNLTISIRDTFEELQPWIHAAMPFGNPTACQDAGSSTCATDAANYVLYVIQAGGEIPSDPENDPY